MSKPSYYELEKKLRELENKSRQHQLIEKELLEKQSILKKQNINLVRKSIELSNIKRDFEDKNYELELARTELRRQNINLTRKSIDLSDIMRELEDKNFDLELSQSDLKKTLNALKESEKRYRQLVESSVAGIYINRNHILKFANRMLAEIFGYKSSGEILGKHVREMIAPESWELVDNEVKLRESGKKKVSRYECKGVKKDGTIIDIEVLGIRIDYQGKPAVLGTLIDITQRKRAAEEKRKLEEQLRQSQKMEAVGTLAGGIAHGFNNILGIITGYTELSIDDLPQESMTRRNLEQVLISSNRAKDLVRQILEFSRKSDKERKSVYVNRITEETLTLLRSSLPGTIKIGSDIAKNLKPVLADSTQIHQVIMNLCTNAAYSMKKNGGILDVGLSNIKITSTDTNDCKGLSPGEYVRLTVSDTGDGMEQSVMDRVFEPYFTTKKVGEGTGMGLAVVHGIIKSYHGEITVTSEPGEGATFNVYIPVTIENKEIEPGIDQTPTVRGGSDRILFVDDEQVVVEMGGQMLKKLGYEVTTGVSGEEALEYFREKPGKFDLIILDQIMPGMTGMQLAREIRTIRPGIPIILCTGFIESIDEESYKSKGISAFIMKPFAKNEIAETIRRVLES